ncbi:hypothetical protein ACJJTC_003339 [Scirpophaga incertulas]
MKMLLDVDNPKIIPNLKDLHLSTENIDHNITRSNKRRRCECGSSSESKLEDFINKLTEWQQDTDIKLANIKSSMDEIHKQNSGILASNAEIEKSIDFLSKKYDDLCTQLNGYQEKTKEYNDRFEKLENKCEELERNSRNSTLEIRNVPTNKNKDVARGSFANSTDNKTVLVILNSIILKNNILKAYRQFNRPASGRRLTSSIFDKVNQGQFIYLSENLTAKCRKIFHMAREYAKLNGYKYCWSVNGKVLLRKEDGASSVTITSESQLTSMLIKN